MSTPWGQIKALFGVKPKQGRATTKRTFANPQTWHDFVEAVNGYSGSTSGSLNVSAVFACNDRISKDIAVLPFRPVRRIDTGQEIARDYDQYKLTKRPNDFLTWYNFSYALNSHVNLCGNGYAPIYRRNGRPVSYGIWHPSKVEKVMNDNRLYWVNTETKEVKSDADMIHLMWYTEDGITGKSVLSYARNTIESSKNAGKLVSEFSKNRMWQPGYLSFKDPMTLEQLEVSSSTWSENYAGQDNAAVTPVLDRDGKYLPFSGMSLKDAEMIESREFDMIDIARFFGVPPSKIGIRTGNVSYNSLEQENTAYVQDTLLPRCIAWEQEFDRKVVSEEDEEDIRFKHELKQRLRGDANARANMYNIMLQHGVYTINDVLSLEDMNTIGEEGDERLVQLNMTTLKNILEGKEQKSNPDGVTMTYTPSKNGHNHVNSVY